MDSSAPPESGSPGILAVDGKLPRPLKIGGAVRWRLDEIRAWLAAGCPNRQEWETTCRVTQKGVQHVG